jgi:Ran GTPase-activating protein (RanGAP) involved in mRNA processing and transport
LDRFVLTKNDDLTPAVLKIIVSSFSKNTKLRVVGFTKNKIGDEGAAVIADGLKDHSGLAKFYLYHTDVTAKGIASLVPALASIKTLIKSVVIENKIGDEGATTFANYIKGSKLTDFVLRDCEIKSAGFKALGAAIKEAKSLLRVDFSENPMDADSVSGIAAGLDGNDHLTHVELAFNNIDAAGAKVLAAALLNNKVLKRVDLSENKIGNDGAKEFATFIEKDTTLEKLDISNNKITTEGAKGVIEAVLKNKNLKRLFFYRNEVEDSLKDMFAKAGDRIKSEYTDELKFKDDDATEDDNEEPVDDEKDEGNAEDDDKPEEPKADAKSPAEPPKKDEL